MEFRTRVDIEEAEKKISYKSKLFLIGSCFTNEIGSHFKKGKIQTELNPFGVLYNPLSTADAIELLLDRKSFTKDDLYFYNNKYLSFSHDTTFSAADPGETLDRINNAVEKATDSLYEATHIFITFGTSWVYRRREDNSLVANCHKIPAGEFTRHLLKHDEIVNRWYSIADRLLKVNSDLNIVFTVSPVRHLKDGAHGNQLSKSRLIVAINDLVSSNRNIQYFPSYEIVLDELRDYRFYNRDMVHPSAIAIDYIWEKIRKVYFERNTDNIYGNVLKIAESLKHELNKNNREANVKFAESMLAKIARLGEDYPFIDLYEEESYFRNIVNQETK